MRARKYPPEAMLRAEALAFSYGDHWIISGSSFAIGEGELVCVLGPSGCGKTTLLNLIAGFLKPTQGRLLCNGNPIAGPGPERAMVFQTGALFDWMTVQENIAFSLTCRNRPASERIEVAEQMANLVGLQDFTHRYPYELSGGMRQRVGVARVLAANPKIMLMDEPFAAVDVQTRENLQEELLRIHTATGCTIILVTHGIDEAVFLADRIFLLNGTGGTGWLEFEIDLPTPRWSPENRLHPAFVAARERIYRHMRRDLQKNNG
jgi:ABC-type nitrate/sulfonate/bicarbonate transport system ATPase subunit